MTTERASFPREVEYAKSFRKDRERLYRSGRYDMGQLWEDVLLLIAQRVET